MNILLIAQEPPLLASQVVTGNAVRCHQLRECLEAGGHRVTQVFQSDGKERIDNAFSGRDSLRSLIIKTKPDAILVSYWELVKLLPFDLEQPLVLDFIAPRPLEQLFENPGILAGELRQLNLVLRKCDLVLVGNELQKHLLVVPMLEAGFDIRRDLPIRVLPLSGRVAGAPTSDPMQDGWTLVSGGISWPWRNAIPYWRAIARYHRTLKDDQSKLKLFGGQYPLHDNYSDAELDYNFEELMPYDKFSEYLLNSAHIGLELAEPNIERRYSQSFRSLEFLRHGLPLICNRYLPIASLVEKFDAGWLIEEPEELPALLARIYADPANWRKKSLNALRLVEEALDPDRVAQPLLAWLATASKPDRLSEQDVPATAELGTPPLFERLKIQFKLGLRALRARLSGREKHTGIVIVTRSDLFPTDHGAAVKIVETAKGLAGHDRKVAIVTEERHRWWEVVSGSMVERRIPGWLRVFALPGMISKLLHFSKDIPLSNSFLYLPLSDGSFFFRTLYVARKIGAGILQAEFPAYARPCLKVRNFLGTQVVMVEHNVEYARLKAQIPELTDAQYDRFKAIELALCNQVNAVICVSDNDRQILAEDGVDPKRLYTIPHGVNLSAYSKPARSDVREKFGIPPGATLLVFHGTFAYEPNVQALSVFAEELLPRLQKLGLSCHVLAIGSSPPPTSPHGRIHLTGSVENLAEWLKSGDIAVVPLLEGGGTRMKIIDCFAASLPLISTSKGIEGIPVENGRDALVIDDWDEMAAAIISLSQDPELAETLAENGHVLAKKLDWHVITRRYLDLYRQI
jgi:glycosyltransferase involved in cell wall biosynthesis